MSEVKVNKISPRSGTTVTLGDSGDTFTIPSGATINNQGTATNFGATGSASWVTTVKTSTFTAVAGEGYFVNTTGGVVSVNLPAGTAGAVVAIKDYARTFDTNKVTLVQNGSDKIGGSTVNATLETEGIAVTLVFIDSTQGWLVTDSGLQSEAPTAEFVTATGGTITTCGNFKIHTFTGPGTFCVSNAGNAAGSNTVDYLVVAGGGGVSALSVTATGFPIAVGGGGVGGHAPAVAPQVAANGSNASFSTITSAGGGFGGSSYTPSPRSNGNGGGSGGGGSAGGVGTGQGGPGNTPPVSPPQGNDGGGDSTGPNQGGHGGGGIGGAGANTTNTNGGAGGAGVTSCVTASPVSYAGGGGGGGGNGTGNNPNSGGGGTGGDSPNNDGGAGTANTGGGGGGGAGGSGTIGGAGGSGVVIIRYKFQ
jgi:hypothetical protein